MFVLFPSPIVKLELYTREDLISVDQHAALVLYVVHNVSVYAVLWVGCSHNG